MNAKQLYQKFEERIPSSLREPWDNDGVMRSEEHTSELQSP